VLNVAADESSRKLIELYKKEIMKTALLRDIAYADFEDGEEIKIEHLRFIVSMIK
jgi:hypothetical protein